MKYLTYIFLLISPLAYGQQQWFINAYGDTLYSRCCVTTLELNKELTATEIRTERKELRKDNKAKRMFDRKIQAWIREDRRLRKTQPFGDEIIFH